jgi:hypothetical protein
MKKFLILFAAAGLTLTACKKDGLKQDGDDLALNAGSQQTAATIVLPQFIDVNTTLTSNNLYKLDGKVFIRNGATLTIQPGTRIEGIFKSTPADASALIVTKTGRLVARGQQANPIIFTSCTDNLPGGRTNRLPGDWGGIVILGDAPTNKPSTQVIEGIDLNTVPVGVDVTYGGTNELHDGGVLSFVRIEFAGAAVSANNELNSLTLGGVGRKTGLNYIMCSNGADDMFEWFGGTVNAKYLIANSGNDDGFDFDFGYRGNIQFGVCVRNPALAYADANGIECDNENPSAGALPTTRPELSNLTIVGRDNLAGTFRGARFRRGTDLRMRNSIVLAYPTAGATFEQTLATNTPAFYRSNATHGTTTDFVFGAPTVGPVGLNNISAIGATPNNWVNNYNIAHASYKSSALVYNATGPCSPASFPPNFAGLTTNFLNVPYIGALGPGSPIRVNGVITVPNNWIAGSAGAWVDFVPL